MTEKLIQLFEQLSPNAQRDLLDYAMMLWEMEQGEKQLREKLFGTEEEKMAKLLNNNFLNKKDGEVN